MTIKTFRGMMAHDTQDIVSLHTNDGSIGYRIVKFQIMPYNFNESDEYTVQIWKTDQTGSIDNVQDFSNNRLLGVAYFGTDGADLVNDSTVIFDSEKFNQDIYITAKSQTGKAINYYIELEAIKLDLNENTVATLKDIRNQA